MEDRLLKLSNHTSDSSLMESVPCNLCGNDDHKILHKIDSLNLVKCKKCDLVFLNPRFKEHVLAQIYENDYFHRKVYEPNSKYFYGYVDYLGDKHNIIRTFENVFRFIEIYKKKGKVLDIGCAFGFFLDIARKKGWETVGAEPSSHACSYAREELNLKVHQETLSEIVLPEEEFDLITLFDVIEHLPDPIGGLYKINRSLKPGGLLTVTTADADSWLARLLGPRLEDMRRINEHLYIFSRNTIVNMLKKCGFEALNIKTTGKFFSMGDLFERLTLYQPKIFKNMKIFFEKIRLDNLSLYVNPGVKITVVAKKIKKI